VFIVNQVKVLTYGVLAFCSAVYCTLNSYF